MQGIPGGKMMKFQFFFGGNGQQSGYAMCDVLCGILAQVRGKSTMCETFAPQK